LGWWNEKEAKMTSNCKEITAILCGIRHFAKVFKEMHTTAVLIHSDNTTAVFNLAKWKAKESSIDKIRAIFYITRQLNLQIFTAHIPGISNRTADALSRLSKSGDYKLKKEIFIMICLMWNLQPTMDLFASRDNTQLPRFASTT
jgi:hypothetical protein